MNGNKKTDQNIPYENIPYEEMNDEMLQAYMEASDMETPDLWDRVEQGFEQEMADIRDEKTIQFVPGKKKAVWRRYAGLAAAVLLCVILIPAVVRSNIKSGEKSIDDTVKDVNDMGEASMMAEEADEETADSVQQSDAEYAGSAEEADDSAVNMGDVAVAVTDSVTPQSGSLEKSEDRKTVELEVSLYWEETENGDKILMAEVKSVLQNDNDEYVIQDGNTLEFDNMEDVKKALNADDTDLDAERTVTIRVDHIEEKSDGRYLCHYIGGNL
ncbi:MAG: hypothetical protein ACI39Q_05680 [Wujia sp.]